MDDYLTVISVLYIYIIGFFKNKLVSDHFDCII